MYRQLTLEHSLFNIDGGLLEEFQRYPEYYSELKPQFNITHPQLDTWAATFNNWLLFLSIEECLIIDHTKTFSHSINILCTNEIEKSESYLSVLSRFNRKERFIVACFLTNEIHSWKRQVIKDNQLEEVLVNNLENDYYYKISNIEFSRVNPWTQQILLNQSRVVKVLMRNIQSSREFERHIKKSIHDAQAFLRYKQKSLTN